MNELEYRIVDADGEPVDEGTDAAWVIYDKRKDAEERVVEISDDDWEGGPFRVQERPIGDWREAST